MSANIEPLPSFSDLFRIECKYIFYLPSMYVYNVYLLLQKVQNNFQIVKKKAGTSVVLIIFVCYGVF